MNLFDRFRLDGKRAFVTGGSRGLGREMALALAEAGADIVLVGRGGESLSETAGAIEGLGRRADSLEADLGDPTACEACCVRAWEEFGPIDILVNNVGGRRENVKTEEMPLETWQQLVDLNLTSVFLCTKRIGGEMIRRGVGGRIINIASVNAMVVGRGIAGRHYEACKAAVVQFTRATAVDWAEHRITCNVICPGGFMTEPNVRWSELHPEVIANFRQQVPLGDFGQPEDLGPLAVYLASDASRYMTGATLVIDGGYSLW
ncbi:MAG: SDR family oxidoreductase [Planctomycetaceae bacterium]|nr:MAG: SDR family oxidoreductase [Planctomycetaceae bacterium]